MSVFVGPHLEANLRSADANLPQRASVGPSLIQVKSAARPCT